MMVPVQVGEAEKAMMVGYRNLAIEAIEGTKAISSLPEDQLEQAYKVFD